MCFFLVLFLYKEKVRRHIFHFMKNMPLLYINAREGVQVVGLRPTFSQLKGPSGLLCLLLVFYCVYTVNDAKMVQNVEIQKSELDRYIHTNCTKSVQMAYFEKFESRVSYTNSWGLSDFL